MRVGDTRETHVDVRVIAATNRDLEVDIRKGQFREDLFYRLSVFHIPLPPLRDRKEDIGPLAEFFVQHFAAKVNKRTATMSPEFLDALRKHPWKGNVRELKNVIERAVLLADDDMLGLTLLPSDFNAETSEGAMELETIEKAHIRKVLALTGGNKTQAARLLDIGLTTLYQKIKDYQLQ